MSFFKSLNLIGLQRTDLSNVSEQDIIRIEKMLLAEHRLNGTVSKNDIDQITRALGQYPDVIRILSGYDCFFGILSGYDAEYIDSLRLYPPEQTERIKHVITTFFIDEITAYIVNNCNTNNWNNIGVLLHYKVFLSNEIMQIMVDRLESKIEFGIALIKQGLSDEELRAKAGFLSNGEFYERLEQTNFEHFFKYTKVISDVVEQNSKEWEHSVFFTNVNSCLFQFRAAYSSRNALFTQAHYDRGSSRTTGSSSGNYGWIGSGIAILIFLLRILSHAGGCSSRSYDSGTNDPLNNYRQNGAFYSTEPEGTDQYGNKLGTDYAWRQNWRMQMEGFEQARSGELNYPRASWNATVLNMAKYINPFSLKMFANKSYRDIKSGGNSINIYNRTYNGCIVMAYYYPRGGFNDAYGEKIYALYLPPKDSMQIDANANAFRFYMGKRLAAFNSDPSYTYPDSLDAKFSKFTKADHTLFKHMFYYDNSVVPLKKQQNLQILQMPSGQYQINWDGEQSLGLGSKMPNIGIKLLPHKQDHEQSIIIPVE